MLQHSKDGLNGDKLGEMKPFYSVDTFESFFCSWSDHRSSFMNDFYLFFLE